MRINTKLDLSQDELSDVVRIHRQATYKLFRNTFISALLWPVVILWAAWDQINHPLGLLWIGAFGLTLSLRLFFFSRWFQAEQSNAKRLYYEGLCLATTFAASCLWGAAMLLLDYQNLTAPSFLFTIIVFALLASSIGLACQWTAYFWSFTVPVLCFYTLIFVQQLPGVNYLLMVCGVAFGCYLGQITHSFYRNNIENIVLRLRLETTTADLQQEKIQAVDLAESRKNFLASASHDLRQPLQAMNLFLSALKPYIKEIDSKTIFGKMEASTEGMNELLNRILDISKLDSNTLNLNITTFDINTVITNLEQEFSAHADKHNLSLNVNSISAKVTNDAVLVQRIISNLLANAINYTIQGSINIDCHIIDKNIVIDVIDTGPGIADEQQKFIFDEFYQVGNLERDRKKGLGLGLSIVKRLSSILDIELSFESRLGEGSRFSISLAQEFDKPISIKPAALSNNWTAANSTVLIIDDEDAVLDGLGTLFQQWHFGVLVANSAKEAVDILQSTEQRPDLIVSDYRLCDGLNGVDAIQDVKDFLQDQDIPSVIISGDTAPERLSEVAKSGYILLHKPVKPAFLRAAIQRLLTN